jgi:hypothetical protein
MTAHFSTPRSRACGAAETTRNPTHTARLTSQPSRIAAKERKNRKDTPHPFWTVIAQLDRSVRRNDPLPVFPSWPFPFVRICFGFPAPPGCVPCVPLRQEFTRLAALLLGLAATLAALNFPARAGDIVWHTVYLCWDAVAGGVYRVQFKRVLEEEAWSDLEGDVTATNTPALKLDPGFAALTNRFYRVKQLR